MFYFWHQAQLEAAKIDLFHDQVNGITFLIFN